MHEASCHTSNCVVTLTLSNEFMPNSYSLEYSTFQLFMKRLRKSYGAGVRFFMGGEYGDKPILGGSIGRPHFHACLFNIDFVDKRIIGKSKTGTDLYTSDILNVLWPFGRAWIGVLDFASAAYVARYCVSPIFGDSAVNRYMYIDPITGEIFAREPEFCRMSLKPGIGAHWYDRFSSDVYPHDYVVVKGKRSKPPRYYDTLYNRDNPEVFGLMKIHRELNAEDHWDDGSPRRLRVREQCALSGVYPRSLE